MNLGNKLGAFFNEDTPAFFMPFFRDANKRMEEIKMANETMRIFFPLKIVTYPQDEYEAVTIMVDTNLEQRESLLPSEKAWGYRMKLEAYENELRIVIPAR